MVRNFFYDYLLVKSVILMQSNARLLWLMLLEYFTMIRLERYSLVLPRSVSTDVLTPESAACPELPLWVEQTGVDTEGQGFLEPAGLPFYITSPVLWTAAELCSINHVVSMSLLWICLRFAILSFYFCFTVWDFMNGRVSQVSLSCFTFKTY